MALRLAENSQINLFEDFHLENFKKKSFKFIKQTPE